MIVADDLNGCNRNVCLTKRERVYWYSLDACY